MQIQELSGKEGIPVKFLEQILLSLKKGGILLSRRGIHGGYFLNRSPEQIYVSDILTLIDGPFIPASCIEEKPPSGLNTFFCNLQNLVNEHLQKHSIQDVLKLGQAPDGAYEI